jgi:3-methyl-2-oxobutanoate hydroxymethyltransferase
MKLKKITVSHIASSKKRHKLTMLTAYDAAIAKLIDEAGVDIALVGDSLGMVIQGQENTIPVKLEDIIYHTKCVARGIERAHIVADMPFSTYPTKTHALLNAGRLLKEGGAESVKLEGGEEIADIVKTLTSSGIPVIAHIGLKPQFIHRMGGYKIHGKDEDSERLLLKEAKLLEKAGAYSLLLEGITREVAGKITDSVMIPTIGIGSGPFCDGQVLVINDLLGMDKNFKPKFVKQYADLHLTITNAVKTYCEEVKTGNFPAMENSFTIEK